ncbi:MAG: hypothetical protein ICV78_01465 [Tolypothrix sp. Co-bin9]|nr:hypothetical protein [Tolypothrix sp. Co-bin9]
MKNIPDIIANRAQAEDISERISLYKLFAGFLLAFAFWYYAILCLNSSTGTNKFLGVEFTDAGFALLLAFLTFGAVMLLVGKKSSATK